MKKVTVLLLSFALLLAFAACESEETPNSAKEDSSVSQTGGSTDDTVSGEDSEKAEPISDDLEPDEGAENPEGDDDTPVQTANQVTFENLVAVDNADCRIEITDIDPDSMWGYTLKVQLENKSTEKTYMFSVENAAINGVQSEPFFASEVAAGKKANEEINFSDSSLAENGITDYTDIELTFRVYDSDDWLTDPVAKETVHVYPYGEDKAVSYVREAQPADTVLADNDCVSVVATGYEWDDIWGYTVNLFLLNKTEKEVMFSVDNASVNGYMADPFFASAVSAGKCTFTSVSWSDSALEENGISEVEEIEFQLRAYDSDDWMGEDFLNETVTLNPEGG